MAAASPRAVTLALVFLFALTAPALAAPRTAVVVGGEPGKVATVTGAAAPWLERTGDEVVLDALSSSQTDALVACFLADDEACARPIVAAAGVDHLILLMVDMQLDGDVENLTLSGWGLDAAGAVTHADRRFCDACRVDPLSRTAVELTAVLRGLAAVSVQVTSVPDGATVSIDGTPAGTTPLAVDLFPGDHAVALALDGYRPHTATLAVAAEPMTHAVTLDRASAARPSRLPWALVGVGAALVATGVVLIAVDKDDNDIPSDQRRYRDLAPSGWLLAITGVAASGGGLALGWGSTF